MKTLSPQKPSVTLDRMENKCKKIVADGEKLKNRLNFAAANNSVAFIHHTVKGKQNQRFCDYCCLRFKI